MPTESAFLLAGLLFVAAALGYIFAKFGDTDEEDISSEKLSSDYMKGLNYVLNEESDRAVEVFTRMAELDDEALETHFALGSLFRKRGEVDRAIRVHENLIARPALTPAQKNQAEAALADDFLSAGLFDRAESMFLTLCDSPEFRLQGLERLCRIYEVTKDWQRAVETSQALDKARAKQSIAAEDTAHVAHYYCEMAEQAWQQKDAQQAYAMLKQAESGHRRTVRSLLVRADILSDSDDPAAAALLYRDAIEVAPDLLVVVLPKLAATHRAAETTAELSVYLHELLECDSEITASIAMAAVRDPAIENPEALGALRNFLTSDPTLGQLVGAERFIDVDETQQLSIINRVRDALRSIVTARPGYVCRECGYACLIMQWQCPGCHTWESIRPIVKINLVSGF
ncbi:MAG TPA: tetratricopeptide repeat protein [Gammaproteobacteria bacterium]|jgi:lipopolysaccharide biosynthesis regulator YciM|nr:tetratricopeptide repeat protein [Gammaproteobacteria bacterium]HJP39960.1 tetratricopeptide repeat protein [Gammaproteobacteria bacterium]